MATLFTIWGFECLRCGHRWARAEAPLTAPDETDPEAPEEARACARCKSPYWNRPKGLPRKKRPQRSLPTTTAAKPARKAPRIKNVA